MANRIFEDENHIYQIDFSAAIWATDQLHETFQHNTSSLLSDVDFVAETEDEIPKSTENGSDTGQTGAQPGTENSGETPVDAGTDGADGTQPSQDGTVVQKEFTVEVGDSSNAVSQRLQEEGLVDNAEAFNKYMVDNNYANFVLPGTVTIPEGAGYEEVAGILTDKTIHH